MIADFVQLAERPCVVFDIDNEFLAEPYDCSRLESPDGTLVVSMQPLPDMQQTRFRLWSERFLHWTKDDEEEVFIAPQIVDQMRAAYQESPRPVLRLVSYSSVVG